MLLLAELVRLVSVVPWLEVQSGVLGDGTEFSAADPSFSLPEDVDDDDDNDELTGAIVADDEDADDDE